MKRALLAFAAALTLTPRVATATTFDNGDLELTIGAHADAFYSYVFANPASGINNARIFDTRHNTFALASAGLSLDTSTEWVDMRIALWFGLTPEAIYQTEPTAFSTGTVGESNSELWRFLQEAYGRAKFGSKFNLEAGLFVSPLGLENVLTKDNWNYSSSNLNYGLPFYHAGLRGNYSITRKWKVTLGVYNGWTGIIDANDGKSIALSSSGTFGRMEWGTTYWTGNERPKTAREGKTWLHHLDGWAKVRFFRDLWIGAQADIGFEPNQIGTSWWLAGALYGRYRIGEPLFFTLRVDYFRDRPGENDNGDVAAPYFFDSDWVSSVTATLDLTPGSNVVLRLEYRHDEAGGPLYFDEDPTRPTADHQNVFTMALVAWL